MSAPARRHHLERLTRDVYEESGTPPQDISGGTTWDFFAGDPTAQFRLHKLQWVLALTETYRATRDPSLADKARQLVHRWLVARGTPDDTPAWHGHATALRTSVLSYLVAAGFCPDEQTRDALREHARFLADDAHYEGAWNHGLDQSVALLHAGQALGEPEFGVVGHRRIAEAAESYVDHQGVVAEQATGYAEYVHGRLTTAAAALAAAGLPEPPALVRRARIPEFIAWATRPDGSLTRIGDTAAQRPSALSDATTYCASGGTRGVAPASTAMVYDDGWAFYRSGWGTERPLAEESLLTVRYGTFRRFHGHRDHTSLTWWTGGRAVLEDPGFSGYRDPAVRQHEQRESAHSLVHLSGAGPFAWSRGTRVVTDATLPLGAERGAAHLLHLTGRPYDGVVRTRSICHLPRLDVLVVRDAVRAPLTVTAHQTWQCGPTWSLDPNVDPGDPTTVALRDDGGVAVIRQHLPLRRPVSAVSGAADPIGGWVVAADGARVPAPCLTWSASGRNPGFLTSLTTRTDLRVLLESGGHLRLLVGEDLVLRLRYDATNGFLAGGVEDDTADDARWNHEPPLAGATG